MSRDLFAFVTKILEKLTSSGAGKQSIQSILNSSSSYYWLKRKFPDPRLVICPIYVFAKWRTAWWQLLFLYLPSSCTVDLAAEEINVVIFFMTIKMTNKTFRLGIKCPFISDDLKSRRNSLFYLTSFTAFPFPFQHPCPERGLRHF